MTPKKDDSLFLREKLSEFLLESDPMFGMLEWLTQRLAQLEAERKVGARKGVHSKERTTHFSGTRVRRFDTRMGTMYLLIPKLRQGGYIPFFVSCRKRSEHALVQVVQEAFVHGVSTRRMEHLARSLGIEGMSPGQVSEITRGLDEQVEQFRTRPLEREYSIIWVDAMYQKIRHERRVRAMAVLVVLGLNRNGGREILAVEPMWEESEATYNDAFDRLRKRGLERVGLVVSDAHAGLQAAIQKKFVGASWQRCKVHFMRNVLARVGHRDKQEAANRLKQIWLCSSRQAAMDQAKLFGQRFSASYPEAVTLLENGLEDTLQYLEFPELDARKISSTNVLERMHREIRRRARAVGVFPSEDSFIRLISSYLMEYADDWVNERGYIRADALESVKVKKDVAA